jgi:hypothetical protein
MQTTSPITDWPDTLPAIWRLLTENGYTVIIRNSNVYLFHAGAPRHCLATEVDNGRWMNHPPVSHFIHSHLYLDMAGEIEKRVQPPWRHVSAELPAWRVMEFDAVTRDCYCYQGVDRCDFCTGTRRPDRYRNHYATEEEARAFLLACGWQHESGATCRFCQGSRWATIGGLGSCAGLPTVYEVREGEYKPLT